MKTELKPLETRYGGCRFRSRLEARWAVFFDALGIRWEYEPAGYRLADGTCYLPDFWLPGLGVFVEVKPQGGDFDKARAFVRGPDRRIWLAEGEPDSRLGRVWGTAKDGCPWEPAFCLIEHLEHEILGGVIAARSERFGT